MGVKRRLHELILDRRDEIVAKLNAAKKYDLRDGEKELMLNHWFNEGLDEALKIVKDLL